MGRASTYEPLKTSTTFDLPAPAAPEVVYVGHRDGSVLRLELGPHRRSRPLNPRFDLARHSPTGFAWGYHGSGPAQLALALCADTLRDDRRALGLYQRLKFKLLGSLAGCGQPFVLPQQRVLDVVFSLELEEAARRA
jgi:uncharacterized protein DUF6166